MDVVIVDYGAGNLRSVARAVAHSGVEATVSARPQDVLAAKALFVPGVGAAEDTMAHLRAGGLVEPILEYIASDRPFLGVCMGQQALFDYSEKSSRWGLQLYANFLRLAKERGSIAPAGATAL